MRNSQYFKKAVFIVFLCFMNFSWAENIADVKPQALMDIPISSEVMTLISKARANPDPNGFPQIILDEQELSLNVDGTVTQRFHHACIIPDKNKDWNYSEGSWTFNAKTQTCVVNYARTILPDNSLVSLQSNKIKIESAISNVGLFNEIQTLEFEMPGIVDGAVVEYEVVIHDKYPVLKDQVNDVWTFEEGFNHYRNRYRLKLPQNKKLQHAFYNTFLYQQGRDMTKEEKEPVKTTDNGQDIYTWTVDDMFLTGSYETQKPSYFKRCPYMIMTTIPSWDWVETWYRDLSKEVGELTPEIEAKVKELTKDLKDQDSIVEALFQFVSQGIRYASFSTYDVYGYKPHKAAEIFKDRFGDCKDKATLLRTMLKAVNIPTDYALILTSDSGGIKRDLPTTYFNHMVLAISKEKDDLLLMDTTNLYTSYDFVSWYNRNAKAFVLKEKGYAWETLELTKPEDNATINTLDLTLQKDDRLDGKLHILFTGENATNMRDYFHAVSSTVTLQNFCKEFLISTFPNSIVKKCNLENVNDFKKPFILTLEFQGQNVLTELGSMKIFPFSSLISPPSNTIASDSRNYAIDFFKKDSKQSKMTIHIPEGRSFYAPPKNVHLDAEGVEFSRKVKEEPQRLIIEDQILIKDLTVSSLNFLSFKSHIKKILKELKQQVAVNTL